MLPKIKTLRWKKLAKSEIGAFQQVILCALKNCPDPYVSVTYTIPAEPCRHFLEALRARSKAKLSFVHVLNKLLACAVAECPSYNHVLLDNKLYCMEGIHIANIALMPGSECAMTKMVLDDAHLKSIEQIAVEMGEMWAAKLRNYERKEGEFSPGSIELMKFFYRSGLYRLMSQKAFYKTGFERGLISNLSLSNLIYGGRPSTYSVTRSITPVIDNIVIHTSGAEKRACVDGDTVVTREILPLTITHHHSVLHGVHAHNFGLALERIASDPEKYLG